MYTWDVFLEGWVVYTWTLQLPEASGAKPSQVIGGVHSGRLHVCRGNTMGMVGVVPSMAGVVPSMVGEHPSGLDHPDRRWHLMATIRLGGGRGVGWG